MRRKSFLWGKLIFALVILVILITAVACPSASTPTGTTTTPPTTTTQAPTGTATASPGITTSPTGTATALPTATVSPGATVSPTVTASPTTTASPLPTGTASPTATGIVPPITGTASPTVTASPTGTASPGAVGSVEVLAVWGGTELDSFNAMVAPWQQQTGGTVNFTGTRDLTAVLATRIQAGNPPDVAILPNPGLMAQFAARGSIQPLNSMLNMNTINQQYPSNWIDLGTINNNLYAIFMKAANKSTIWYNPKTFSAGNWQIPATWNDLIALSDRIVAAAGTPANPWSVGVEAAQASGFPATDWIAQIFLSKYGGEAYDQWVNHEIPWTDPRIRDAWEMFGTIVNTPNYVAGGTTAVLATNFQDASYQPFQTPPAAVMYYEGDFVAGFIKAQFPNLVAGQDFDFFPFPSITAGASPSPGVTVSPAVSPTTSPLVSPGASPTISAGAVTGGADLVVAFKDTPTIRSFISYLATPEAQSIWVKRGGFTSVNMQVNLSDYPDVIAQKSAQQLLNASVFRFGAGDVMPGAMQTAWWAATLQYLQNPGQLTSILTNLENTAASVYRASPGATSTASPAVSPSLPASPSPTASP